MANFDQYIASEKGGFFSENVVLWGGDETDAEKEAVGIFVVKECWLRTFLIGFEHLFAARSLQK